MRTRAQILLALAGAVTGAAIAAAHAQAQAREHSYAPAPPAVADYFPEAYPGAAILPSARVDTTRGTATLPLHRGRMRDGRAVWYVLTDASERRFARRHGLNWSPKLRAAPAAATRASRMLGDGTLEFARGTVDFRPERRVVPGAAPDFCPPAVAAPGAAGDADYSPLARVANRGGLVLNASVVAFGEAASAIEFPDGDETTHA